MTFRGSGSSLLREAIAGQRWVLLGAVTLLAGWQAAEALVPVLVGVIIDRAIATGDAAALAGWLVVLAALFTALTMGFRFGARLTARATEHAGLDLRVAITRRVLDPRGGTGTGRLPGELLSIATADVSRVARINETVARAVVAASGLTVAAVVLLSASVQLGLVVLVGLPPVLIALNMLTGPLERRSTAEQEQAARATAVASDLIGGLR
ncbi:MAG: ABC transporter transmembrane domain-containing protein, partial [Actinomycetota bacterium]|nr:ABC transporter transmembrane domain-containing protein [Actinomycetota bacterium]